MITFGNPLGFWALLALPVIFAIHFLQRESRQSISSTLFLLEQLAPISAEGRRFERLRTSSTLWLQILAALLLTWLLVQPRWLRTDSTQHVVVLLDSSVSMSAFRNETSENLGRHIPVIARDAARTEWQLLETDTTRPTLYSGPDYSRLLDAVRRWKPHLGTHDFAPALQNAQIALHGNGTLLFVTDRPCPLPAGVRLLAVGHPLDNCGFTGATVEERRWRALLRNYGQSPQKRSWWMEANGQRSSNHEVNLKPGEDNVLEGEIPPGATSCELVLTPDEFALDDRLPIAVPQPKRLRVSVAEKSPLTDFFTRFIGSLQAIDLVREQTDIQLAVYDSFAPALPKRTAIVFVEDPTPSAKFLPGNVTAEDQPLTRELNWSGLLCRDTLHVPPKPNDQTLVWQGERSLVFLREEAGASLLVVNFDLHASNADRLPALFLLMNRFVDHVRATKVAPETRNVETSEKLIVAADPHLPAPSIGQENSAPLSAPAKPSFFDVKQEDKILLHGAAQFSDAREADFRDAASTNGLQGLAANSIRANSEADFLAPLWVFAMGVAMATSWTRKES